MEDAGLNADPLSRESITLQVEANKRNEPIHDVVLTETDSNTGMFIGSVLVRHLSCNYEFQCVL